MESSEKSSTVQELLPNQDQGYQPIYPTSSPSAPPNDPTYPPTSTPSVPSNNPTYILTSTPSVPPGNPIYPPTSTPLVPPDNPTYPPTSLVPPGNPTYPPTSLVPPGNPTYPPTSTLLVPTGNPSTPLVPSDNPNYPPTSSVPPGNVSYPAYPTTTMPGGQSPVMYRTAYPTTHVVMAQPPGTYPIYYQSVPANMTQHQPGYPPTNLPPYPITTAPGPHPQFNSQQAYPRQTTFESQQQYPLYQDSSATRGTTRYSTSKPSTYLCCSILSMIFCCCPLGLVAVIFSSKASDAVVRQDWDTARRYSGKAFAFSIVSVFLGFILYTGITVYKLS